LEARKYRADKPARPLSAEFFSRVRIKEMERKPYLVIGTIAGAALGAFLMPAIQVSGNHESAIWIPTQYIVGGAIAGLVAGIGADLIRRANSRKPPAQ
jgi:outer membrane lipoprotein SlyB